MDEGKQLITHPYFIRSLHCGRAAFALAIGALVVDIATDLSRLIVYSVPMIIALIGTLSFILAGVFVARALGEDRRGMIAGTARSLLLLPRLLYLDALNFWLRLILGKPRR